MQDKGMARIAIIAIALTSALCASALSVAQAREPHRPPTRGTIFIPIGADENKDTVIAPKAMERAPMPTFAEAAPAEAAWAAIPDAPALAQALRALVALDADKVRRAPDMAAAIAAHLPRYRLVEATTLRASPSSDSAAIMRLAADELLILLAIEGSWQQVYVPSLHALGWKRRAALRNP
ncbi:hypothetical protein [Algiphilus sp.]|uniref:hypothetical protein n=1 Tax=Algiphilus sp. TaxID=1872431 RepID=UPI002A6133B4|nr:hypothetical protein [Pseudomonadota bacterium]